MARIDVLIPAYNAEATIAEAVGSIQRQSFGDIRILVVDDGSTDRTPDILRALAATDPRLEIVTQENGGIVAALNVGLARCTAELVARHDADDIAFEHRLETQLAYLDTHPECVAVGANVWHIDGRGKRTGTRSTFSGDVAPDPASAPSYEPYLIHPFLLVRRAAMQAVGGYRYFFHAEDTDLYWRLLRLGALHNLPDILGEYRMHDSSVSSQSVVNGRIAALMAQLAAVDHRRRENGRKPLSFERDDLVHFKGVRSLAGMIHLVAGHLDDAELDWLEIATAGKILELIDYRPYSLDEEDWWFIRRVIARHGHILEPKNLRALRSKQVEATIKLGKARRLREMLTLAPIRLVAAAAGRVAGRSLGLA